MATSIGADGDHHWHSLVPMAISIVAIDYNLATIGKNLQNSLWYQSRQWRHYCSICDNGAIMDTMTLMAPNPMATMAPMDNHHWCHWHQMLHSR